MFLCFFGILIYLSNSTKKIIKAKIKVTNKNKIKLFQNLKINNQI